jgi:uncharacterized protein YbcV (DUF1398 family)
MEYKLAISVEKVIEVKVNADSEEEAIEKAKQKLMSGKEDFAQILDVYAE